MKTTILSLAFALVALTVSSQTVLTLDECRSLALENNVAVRNAERGVQSAREQKREAFTGYFPTVSAVGAAAWFNEDVLSMVDRLTVAGVTAVLPVFAGGRIVNGNKLASLGLDVSRIQWEQQQDEVCLTAEKYFWTIVTLEEKLRTLDRIYAMLETLCHDVSVAVDAGVTMRNDLLQVQLQQNSVESGRISLRNGIRVSKSFLAQYIGVADTALTLRSGIDTGSLPEFPLTLRQDHRAVLSSNNDYRLLEKNVESARLQRKMEVGKNLPSMGVGVGYSYYDMMDMDSWFGMVFATVSVPLSGWWGGSHAIKRKKIAERTAVEQFEDTSEQLLILMDKYWDDVEDAYKQLAIARQSIEQAEENERLNEDFYRAGTTQMSDLLDAQRYLQQASDSYVEAYADYLTKISVYKIATGCYSFGND